MNKVGDKVYSEKFGYGHVEDISSDYLGIRFNCDSYRAYDRKTLNGVWFNDDSVQFIKSAIKVGDTVTLIDNFYEHEKFKSDSRRIRKQIASLKDIELEVKDICIITNRASTGKINYSIPLELLRKVEPTTSKYRQQVARLLRDYFAKHPTKHRFTDEQIAEAQRIIGEIYVGFKNGGLFYVKETTDSETVIRYTTENGDGMHTSIAHCSPHDEFNRTIGVLVALCKAVGRKLPDWL